jgi:hypothetical protein
LSAGKGEVEKDGCRWWERGRGPYAQCWEILPHLAHTRTVGGGRRGGTGGREEGKRQRMRNKGKNRYEGETRKEKGKYYR